MNNMARQCDDGTEAGMGMQASNEMAVKTLAASYPASRCCLLCFAVLHCAGYLPVHATASVTVALGRLRLAADASPGIGTRFYALRVTDHAK